MTSTNTLYPDDLVIAILHAVPKTGERRVTADRRQLHQAFFELRGDFPFLTTFCFRNKGYFPESETLDQAFSNLEASGLLERRNETPKYYYVLNQLDRSFDLYIKKRLEENGIAEEAIIHAAEMILPKLSSE